MTVGELIAKLRTLEEETEIRVISTDIADDIGTVNDVEKGEDARDNMAFLIVG